MSASIPFSEFKTFFVNGNFCKKKKARSIHTQKRHRPVTACCTFRPDTGMISYTRKNAWSVTAFNSTDIRSVQDNVAVTDDGHSLYQHWCLIICIHQSWLLIYLIPTASMHQCCWSIMPVLTDCNSLFPTYLYYSVTSDWYSPDNPTDCSSLILSVLNSL